MNEAEKNLQKNKSNVVAMIQTSGLVFEYADLSSEESEAVSKKDRIDDGSKKPAQANADALVALKDVNICIQKGEFVAVLGHNGSGKSTFAKHINALLLPTKGAVWVNGYDTQMEENTWKIRQSAGMVFQNPDNQIIASIVEEDIAFGPENMGVPAKEIRGRVDNALKLVGMTEYAEQPPHFLSGGQKQRIGIAGVLAMRPDCIVLDEPTAMLDPVGRREVIETITRLNREEGITVILITHYMDEAVKTDRVVVMDGGKIIMDGTPREVFVKVDELKKIGLDVPQVTEIAYRLQEMGYALPNGILQIEELRAALKGMR